MTDSTDRLTIVEFIDARLTEDETIARTATQGKWEWGDGGTLAVYEDWKPCPYPGCRFDADAKGSRRTSTGHEHRYVETPVAMAHGYDDPWIEIDAPDAAHIARHDPARVLRQCALHRKLLEQYASAKRRFPDGDEQTTRGGIETMAWFDLLRVQLRYVAAVWSDHPDCRTEWDA